jgi:hypothetical protein
MIRRDFSGSVTVSARQMLRRRAKLRRREARLYGHGSWASLYRSAGPHSELVGRRIAELSVRKARRTRARLVNPRALTAVSKGSGLVPAQIAGSVTGPGKRRDLAVAINGRIEAVTRTFVLRGQRRESFAAMVPEQSLRDGDNRVQVFQVTGQRPRLRILGSTG